MQTFCNIATFANVLPVTGADNYSTASALHSISREESQVTSLQGVVMGEVRGARLGLRLSSQGRVVNLEKVASVNT